MSGQQGWQCQGRQEHGWFGGGTCGDGGAAAAEPAVYGVVGHLPAAQRARWAAPLDQGGARRLAALLAIWARAPGASDAAFRAAWLPEMTSDRIAGLPRVAAQGAAGARTPDQQLAASGALAEAVQAVGLDRWARFVAAAEDARANAPAAPVVKIQASVPEEDETRGLAEEFVDPLAQVRIAQFNAATQRLREVQPDHPALNYIVGPHFVPTQRDIDQIDDALEAAILTRVRDYLMPGGNPIGVPGRGSGVRELAGGMKAAQAAFDYLRVGGVRIPSGTYDGSLIRLPGNTGIVGLRPVTSSPESPSVDVNIPGIPFKKIHY